MHACHAVRDPLARQQRVDVCDEALEFKNRDEFTCIEERKCGFDGQPPCTGVFASSCVPTAPRLVASYCLILHTSYFGHDFKEHLEMCCNSVGVSCCLLMRAESYLL